MITCDVLAGITPHAEKNIRANWPLITGSLSLYGIDSLECEIAAAATVHVETAATFAPITEIGGPTYFAMHYDDRRDLGNIYNGDGYRFRGRGFVQLTGRSNYVLAGRELGIELVGNPDLALNPEISAKLLARFFKDHAIHEYAGFRNWPMVRHKVNGGTIRKLADGSLDTTGMNGYADFISIIKQLEAKTAIAAAAAHN